MPYPPGYLPFYLAWDLNFLPDQQGKHETEDLGDDEYMILLASHNIQANMLFIVDQQDTE